MDTITFLESVLSSEGLYCIFAANGSQNKRKQYFFDELPDAIEAAGKLDARGYDTYFALSTFEDNSSRKVDNVKHIKAFFLDIDCGEGKPYATQHEGLEALNQFRKTVGLPAPAMVNSGRGVHAYWPLTKPISVAEWVPVAEQFKAKCTELGFEADPAVTSDAARVLRLPETHNHKDNPPKRACILGNKLPKTIDIGVFQERIGDAPISAPVPRDKLGKLMSMNQKFISDKSESHFRDIMQKTVEGKGCAQVEYIYRNQGSLEEPLWRAGLSIANCCVDREKAAKVISSKHPQYNREEALEKMRRTVGPYTCDTFDKLNPDVCDGCPHKGKIGSPIVLGRRISEASAEDNEVQYNQEPAPLPEAPVAYEGTTDYERAIKRQTRNTVPDFPDPYFRIKGGGVGKYEMNDEGEREQVIVYKYDLYAAKRVRDPEEGESIIFVLNRPRDGESQFTIPLAILNTAGDELKKRLGKEGIRTDKYTWQRLIGYIMSWLDKLQEETIAADARTQFGWDEDLENFVVGDLEIQPGGNVVTNAPSSRTGAYFRLFEPKGTLEAWKAGVADFFNHDQMVAHQYVICGGFGSILMPFLKDNVQAAAAHLYSGDSGLGKTTAIWAAASIWGNYKQLCSKAKDTANSTLNRAEVWKNLPLYVDELTSNSDSKAAADTLVDYVMSITQGQQRNRMKGSSNEERFRGEPWNLISVSTGNISIGEKISVEKMEARAEAQRILEIHINDFTTIESGSIDVKELNMVMEHNFGTAGVYFAMEVQKDRARAQKVVNYVFDKVVSIHGLNHKNRFWIGHVTMSIAGGLLAKEWGILDYDMKKVMQFSKEVTARNKENVENATTEATEVINQYVNAHYNDMLIIPSQVDGRTPGLEMTIQPIQTPKRELLIRYENDTTDLFLIKTPFRNWCIKRGINFGELLAELQEKYDAEDTRVRVNKGTHLKMSPTRVIKIKAKQFQKWDDTDDDDEE